MLNWTALWIGSYLVGFQGPLQDPAQESVPVTAHISEGAKLNVFWATRSCRASHRLLCGHRLA